MIIVLSVDRIFGRFEEFGYKPELSGPIPINSIQKHLTNGSIKKDEHIMGYLEKGFMLSASRDLDIDPLDRERSIIGGGSFLTDGYWLWTRYVAYFYGNYNFVLPAEFIYHIKSNNFVVPDLDRNNMAKLMDKFVKIMQLRGF